MIAICSIAKSGTTYFRLVLSNYLQIVYGDPDVRVTYQKMAGELFPNRILSSIRSDLTYVAPADGHIIHRTPYRDVLWDHAWEYVHLLGRNSKTVHLYRNPLDALVSHYFYFWENRPPKERIHTERADAPISDAYSFFPYMIDNYAAHFSRLRELAQARENVLRVSYESMMINPSIVFSATFDWLGLEISMSGIDEAIRRSSRSSVRKEEERSGRAIHAWEGFKGSFVRSGEVGEWQEHLSPEQRETIEKELDDRGIRLDEFQLRAPD